MRVGFIGARCFAQLNITGVQNAIRLTEPLACGVDCYIITNYGYIEWPLQL